MSSSIASQPVPKLCSLSLLLMVVPMQTNSTSPSTNAPHVGRQFRVTSHSWSTAVVVLTLRQPGSPVSLVSSQTKPALSLLSPLSCLQHSQVQIRWHSRTLRVPRRPRRLLWQALPHRPRRMAPLHPLPCRFRLQPPPSRYAWTMPLCMLSRRLHALTMPRRSQSRSSRRLKRPRRRLRRRRRAKHARARRLAAAQASCRLWTMAGRSPQIDRSCRSHNTERQYCAQCAIIR